MELEFPFDKVIDEAKSLMSSDRDGKLRIVMLKIYKLDRKVHNDCAVVVKHATYQNYVIIALESGTLEVFEDRAKKVVVKPNLRKIAGEVSISTVNSKGNPYNTRYWVR